MKLNEITKFQQQMIFESLKEDTDNTFSLSTLNQISESVANFDNSQQGMTVNEAIRWLNSL